MEKAIEVTREKAGMSDNTPKDVKILRRKDDQKMGDKPFVENGDRRPGSLGYSLPVIVEMDSGTGKASREEEYCETGDVR